jgi:glycosyltransferase involved in cell wall biosynthesis
MTIARARRYEICHLFASPLEGESRMFKELATAEKIFPADALLAIGLDKGTGELTGKLQGRYPYERIRLSTQNLPKSLPFQLVKYVEWTLRAASRARASGAKILHCHSLPALPAAVLAARFGRARILYDAHELESKRANMSKARQQGAATLERLLMHFVDEVLVVSPSIKDHYERAYPQKTISLFMNLPSERGLGPGVNVRERFGIPPEHKTLIYVGALAPMRGIDHAVEAVRSLEDWHCVFLGSGSLEAEIRNAAISNTRIHYHPPVAEKDIVHTVATADLSYSVIDCSAESYRLALPNKLFQSLAAGVPVLVNEANVDMLQAGKRSGMVFGIPYSVDAIRNFLSSFSALKVPRSKETYSWESQEDVLISACCRLEGSIGTSRKTA